MNRTVTVKPITAEEYKGLTKADVAEMLEIRVDRVVSFWRQVGMLKATISSG